MLDNDGDGLPDMLEDSSTAGGLPWQNPGGGLLPNIGAMGAREKHKDLFMEVNAMRANPGTTYGSASAPVSTIADTVTDLIGHNHLPTPEVLKMVGDAYQNAPVSNLDGVSGIRVHIDVGDIAAYHALGGDYASPAADSYLIGTGARGGELILEAACVPGAGEICQFPDYPGTVAWKFGMQKYRDAPVGPGGQELTPAQEDYLSGESIWDHRWDCVRPEALRSCPEELLPLRVVRPRSREAEVSVPVPRLRW